MQIKFNDVSFSYDKSDKNERFAIRNVNLEMPQNKIIAICGHTGSGKSTFVQHLNALLRPTTGEVVLGDYTVGAKNKIKKMKNLRKQVGYVFQFPEYQLFEESVLKDLMYGPLNFGYKKEAAKEAALRSAKLVGLDNKILSKLPFKLSGGQMRKVAIAGMLAVDPDVLVLDEPTVGLDPMTARHILELLLNLKEEHNKTIILVTHDMNVVSNYADHVILFNDGQVIFEGNPHELFTNDELVKKGNLGYPDEYEIINKLNSKLGASFSVLENFEAILEKVEQIRNTGDFNE